MAVDVWRCSMRNQCCAPHSPITRVFNVLWSALKARMRRGAAGQRGDSLDTPLLGNGGIPHSKSLAWLDGAVAQPHLGMNMTSLNLHQHMCVPDVLVFIHAQAPPVEACSAGSRWRRSSWCFA